MRHRPCSYQDFLRAHPKSRESNSQVLGCTGCGRGAARTRVGGGEGLCRTICGSPLCPILWDLLDHILRTHQQHFHSSNYVLLLGTILGLHEGVTLLALDFENTHLTGFILVAAMFVRVSKSVEDQVVASDNFCTAGPGRCVDVH